MGSKTPVIFNHSAAIDDFVSTVVLSTMQDMEIKGIIVTNADCIAEPAMDATSRVHQFLGLDKMEIPIALSEARGWNAFPWDYRKDCITMGTIDILKPYVSQSQPPFDSGERLFARLLEEAVASNNPAIVLATGPISALTNTLREKPHLLKGIKEVVWMGGALNVKGNLDPKTIPREIANQKAEWNAFWDPFAVQEMFDLLCDVKVFPLDITDQAKITDSFKNRLRAQSDKSQLSKFVFEAYQLVKDEPFYEMWNTLATCYLGNQADTIFAAPAVVPLSIDLWGNDTQGWIHEQAGGNKQAVFQNFADEQSFYDYVLKQISL
jgi:purine nucleosidase